MDIVSISRIKTNRKKFKIPFNPVFFFVLINVKYFELLSKHSTKLFI